MFSICGNCCIKLWTNEITSRRSIEPCLNKYTWKEINYPSEIDNWKTFQKNNPTIALNFLHFEEKQKCPPDLSKLIRIVKNK